MDAKKKILIIDDEEDIQKLLKIRLEQDSFTVVTAGDGASGAKIAEQEMPDLILMDVVMPGQNGFQLTRAITRNPLYSDIPIIMCTSKNQETDRVWGMRQGARDYIAKPVDPNELRTKINALNGPV